MDESADSLKRIQLLKVPVDILREEDFESVIKGMVERGGTSQIVLLSVWDLLKARRNPEYRSMVANASLVVPVSLSLVKAARFLKKEEPVRYMPFDFIIRTLTVLESTGKTAYLLGSGKKTLQTVERNLKTTFRGLRIVGRFAGHYKKSSEISVISAIQKATPDILLVGKGVHGRERWIPRNVHSFKSGMFLWCSNAFEVLAEKAWRPSRETFRKGLEWVPYLRRKPWKAYRFFLFVYFKLLLIVYRIGRL